MSKPARNKDGESIRRARGMSGRQWQKISQWWKRGRLPISRRDRAQLQQLTPEKVDTALGSSGIAESARTRA